MFFERSEKVVKKDFWAISVVLSFFVVVLALFWPKLRHCLEEEMFEELEKNTPA